MRIENIKVLEGLSNSKGNAGTSAFNIIAHVQYFQTNMYYCVLPINSGMGDAEGTRRTTELMWPTTPAGAWPPPVDRKTGLVAELESSNGAGWALERSCMEFGYELCIDLALVLMMAWLSRILDALQLRL